jgi:catechol 2,3-dioxygenase-like lactoylglutathione lyase family enzyme
VLIGMVMLGLVLGSWWWMRPERLLGEDKKAESAFSSETIDLGICVSNIEKSAEFYKAIGFTEQEPFGVPADFAAEAGLTDRKPLKIRVFTLGKEKTATKIKLMQVEGTNPKASDNAFIHSQLGIRYLTVFVTDMNAAMDRLKKANVTALGRAPHPLPKGLPEGVFLTVFRDPDGNLIEFVGPKK